jgi:hypothetical protein
VWCGRCGGIRVVAELVENESRYPYREQWCAAENSQKGSLSPSLPHRNTMQGRAAGEQGTAWGNWPLVLVAIGGLHRLPQILILYSSYNTYNSRAEVNDSIILYVPLLLLLLLDVHYY